MTRHQVHRRSIPLWHVVPLVLIPPAVVAAVSLYLDLALTPFLYTCAISVVVLMLLISPHSRLLWALAFAVIVLGIILLVGGFNVADWAAAALTWTMSGLRSGV